MISTDNPACATPQRRLVLFTLTLGIATVVVTFLWNSLHKTDWIGQLLGWNGVLAVGMVNLLFVALVVIYSTVRRDPLIVRSVVACLILPAYAAAVNILTFHAASLEMPLFDATFALGKVSEPWTAMQSRQLSYVAEFTTDIRHIPGSENIVADTLSRPPPAALPAAATGGPAVAAVAASSVSLDYARKVYKILDLYYKTF